MLSPLDALVRCDFFLLFSTEAANEICVQCKSNRVFARRSSNSSIPMRPRPHTYSFSFRFSSPCSFCATSINQRDGTNASIACDFILVCVCRRGISLLFSYRSRDLWAHIDQNIYFKIKLLVEQETEAHTNDRLRLSTCPPRWFVLARLHIRIYLCSLW